MSDTNKQIRITGGAVTEPTVGKKRRTSRKQSGGADIPAVLSVSPTPVPTPAPASAPAAAAPQTSTPLVRTNIPATMLGGKAKVILEPPKKTAAKLVASKSKTRKSRKIRVSLSGLGKRITRHKKIQKDARLSSIEEIKKTLVAAKLIKPESKAPETMLRQIYADYQTLKNKAL